MQMSCCHCREDFSNSEKSWYGLHKNCFKELFKLEEEQEFCDLVIRSQSRAPLDNNESNASFFSGAYRKYAARLEEKKYILKIQQKEYPELPATEFLCNQIFESLSLSIPQYYLIRFPEDQFCFVTKNFISELAVSSLLHMYHFMKKGMSYNCENLVTIIAEQTRRRTEQEKFVYLTLADSLIGNHDRHGRNLGFIQSATGLCLAPFYDNPSALALEEHALLGADLQPRGCIFTKESQEPTIKEYVREWDRLGYGSVVDRFRKNLSLEKIASLIERSYLSEKRQRAFLRLITKRSEELCEI